MKLKVTVNDVAYDVDVDVDKTPNAPMAPILWRRRRRPDEGIWWRRR